MKNLKILGVFIAFALIVGGGAFWYARYQDSMTQRTADAQGPGKPAPGFSLQDASGKTVTLEQFKGQAVVLHFWAKWCPPCIEELPEWLKAAKRFEGKPMKWVAISLDRSWDDAHKIIPKEGLPENVVSLLDAERIIPDLYGSYQFPESYVLNRDLQIVEKWVGAQDWSNPAIVDRLGALAQ